jgi:16S rRNA (guanine1516-N2)-methyltransferase
MGLRGKSGTVVDATAGLARDAFLLACLGCTVTAVERSPVLGVLIRDGLIRAAGSDDLGLVAVVDRMKLVVGDAREVVNRMAASAAPDVVYLDPMYPPRTNSALAKKEMRVLRRLVGDDPDAGALLAAARTAARQRVVVKRCRRAPPLAPRPAMQYMGKQVRYDVYHTERESRERGS